MSDARIVHIMGLAMGLVLMITLSGCVDTPYAGFITDNAGYYDEEREVARANFELDNIRYKDVYIEIDPGGNGLIETVKAKQTVDGVYYTEYAYGIPGQICTFTIVRIDDVELVELTGGRHSLNDLVRNDSDMKLRVVKVSIPKEDNKTATPVPDVKETEEEDAETEDPFKYIDQYIDEGTHDEQESDENND